MLKLLSILETIFLLLQVILSFERMYGGAVTIQSTESDFNDFRILNQSPLYR